MTLFCKDQPGSSEDRWVTDWETSWQVLEMIQVRSEEA